MDCFKLPFTLEIWHSSRSVWGLCAELWDIWEVLSSSGKFTLPSRLIKKDIRFINSFQSKLFYINCNKYLCLLPI